MAEIGDGERSDFNFIDIKRMIPLENALVIRAQIAYYIDSEDTLIGKFSQLLTVCYKLYHRGSWVEKIVDFCSDKYGIIRYKYGTI